MRAVPSSADVDSYSRGLHGGHDACREASTASGQAVNAACRNSSQKPLPNSAQWSQSRIAGLAVRVVTVVVPFAAAVGVIVGLGRAGPKPTGTGRLGWYAGICVAGWLVSWAVHHIVQRLLPLALLLEMSLAFPERAPSRLRLARRAASNRDLEDLVAGRADAHETTQQAAERILALVTALGRHDRRTRGHSERVRAFTDLSVCGSASPLSTVTGCAGRRCCMTSASCASRNACSTSRARSVPPSGT